MEDLSLQFENALLAIDRLGAKNLITSASDRLPPMELVDQVIVSALTRIGSKWERGEIALAQVYMGGRICEELVDTLLPLGDPQRKNQPPMAIATLDDYHMLGKRIVYSVMRAAGFDLKDYGRMTADQLIKRVKADQTRILMISTLMLNSALHVADLVDGLKAEQQNVKVIVGGAPFIFDSRLWRDVKADAVALSASDVVAVIESITEGMV